MINSVVLVGRLVRSPELKKTTNDVSVCQFTLAVNRRFSKDGEQTADFINCVVWKNQADNLVNYVKKGALLGVEGRIQTRNYEQDGRTVYVTEVVCDSVQFLEPKKQEEPQTQSEYHEFEVDDSLPF